MELLTSSATSFLYDVNLLGAIKLGTLMFVSKLGVSLDPPYPPLCGRHIWKPLLEGSTNNMYFFAVLDWTGVYLSHGGVDWV